MDSDPGWSCETQLLKLTTTLHTNLENRKQTDLIVLDFSKAFDKVSHTKLISKIDYYGIRGDTQLGYRTSYTEDSNE